jgi:hypothetical protein
VLAPLMRRLYKRGIITETLSISEAKSCDDVVD